jgi:metal-sulfur cluster biosynthetic enzyme
MTQVVDHLVTREYAFGFHTDVETELAPKGLTEDVVRLIPAEKHEPEWLHLAYELEAEGYGERVVLSAGGEVEIVQQHAVGMEVVGDAGAAADADSPAVEFDLDRVMDALGGVYDPEIPVSIVELGLVYRCDVIERPDGTRRIEIDMSMTAPGCGMGDVLRIDAERAVLAVPGVDDVHVELVWDPPWTMHRISEAARLQLGLL